LRDGSGRRRGSAGPPGQVIDGIKSIEAKYPGLEMGRGLPAPAEFIE
jgi:hypothetical protein